jgi:hypothetical protein
VIAAAVWAMFQSLKAIVTFVTGLLPGGGRGSLMLTAAETIVALLLIVFTSVFLSVFLLVIQALFAASKGESIPKTFVIVDILIIVGIFVYMRQRKQLKAAAQRLAQWMSQRPGGAPATRLPERAPGIGLGAASTAVRTATGLAQLRAQRAAANREVGPTFVDNRQQAAVFFPFPRRNDGGSGPLPHVDVVPTPRPGGGGPGRPQLPGGPDRPQLPPGGPGQPTFACPQRRPTPDPGAQEGRRGPRARGHPRRPGVCHRRSLDRGDRRSTRRQRRQDRPSNGSGRPDDAQRQPGPADADADQAGTPARSPAATRGPGDPGRGHLLDLDPLDLPVRPAAQHPLADPAAAPRQGHPRPDRQEHPGPGQEARSSAACPSLVAGARHASGEEAIPAEHARCSAAVRERPARRPAAPAAG